MEAKIRMKMQRTFHLLRIVICDEMVHFCSVRHSCLPVFSKLRRSGWRQKTLEPKHTAYSQRSGFSTRQYERSIDSPQYLVRHISGSGRLRCLLTVLSIMILPIGYFGERPPSALLRRLHRYYTINTCRPEVRKIRLLVADLEVAHPVPPQDGVIPAPLLLAKCDCVDAILWIIKIGRASWRETDRGS